MKPNIGKKCTTAASKKGFLFLENGFWLGATFANLRILEFDLYAYNYAKLINYVYHTNIFASHCEPKIVFKKSTTIYTNGSKSPKLLILHLESH